MTTDGTDRSEGFIPRIDYDSRTPGRVVAREFRRVIDFAIDQLLEVDGDGFKKTDVGLHYATALGQMIHRNGASRRAPLLSGAARKITDQASIMSLDLSDRYAHVKLQREVLELRTRNAGERPRQTVNSLAYFYYPGAEKMIGRFEYSAQPGNHVAWVRPGESENGNGKDIPLYNGGYELTLGRVGLEPGMLRDMAAMLNAAARACGQPLMGMTSYPEGSLAVRDPYDARRGFGGRIADLALTRTAVYAK